MRRPAARRVVSRVDAVACSHRSGWFGSAGWSFSAGARCRLMVPRRVMFESVSCVRAWPHSVGGDPDVLGFGVLAGLPEYKVDDGLVEAVTWGRQVPEGVAGELGPALL